MTESTGVTDKLNLCAYFRIAKQCSGHAHQLSLSYGKILTVLHDCRIQLLWQTRDLAKMQRDVSVINRFPVTR